MVQKCRQSLTARGRDLKSPQIQAASLSQNFKTELPTFMNNCAQNTYEFCIILTVFFSLQ